jgi:hypothetical protein
LQFAQSAPQGEDTESEVSRPNHNDVMAVGKSSSTTQSSTLASPNMNPPVEEQYKKIICGLLKIEYNTFGNLALFDLRVYARAYNTPLRKVDWTYPGFPNYLFTGSTGYILSVSHAIGHFAQIIRKFEPLALARGDLMPDLQHNPDQETRCFDTCGNHLMDQALGRSVNPFGLLF